MRQQHLLRPPDLDALTGCERQLVQQGMGQDLPRLKGSVQRFDEDQVSDILWSRSPKDALPDMAFDHLRWGGQLIVASRRRQEVAQLARQYQDRAEFDLEQEPHLGRWSWRGRGLSWFVARKVLLDRPAELTTRHSFDVRLTRDASGHYVVLKQVPDPAQITQRLLRMAPQRSAEFAQRMARKLVTHVFPIFLSREAAFLKIVGRDLPPLLRHLVPSVLALKRDGRGLVTSMHLNWLRQGGAPISPVTFAQQAAALLQAIHTHAKVVHLDLRLDNFVITPKGVGLVDFGSAVRLDEDIARSPMLETLFHEMFSASQIRRDLRRLQGLGRVTSPIFEGCYDRLDPAIDLFYLALQMTRPHRHGEFRGLVCGYETPQQESAMLRLRRDVLRPEGSKPLIQTADDLLQALERVGMNESTPATRASRASGMIADA